MTAETRTTAGPDGVHGRAFGDGESARAVIRPRPLPQTAATRTHEAGPDTANGVRIEPCPDGPLLIRGADHIVYDGERFEVERPVVAMCRCGGSAVRPFCDATHKLLNKRART